MATMSSKTKKTNSIPTEADGTRIADLQAWRRDSYGAFARGEITRAAYDREVSALQARIDALQAKR